MLKTITSFFSALVLSVVSLFALYTPNASAATLEWTGGGADLNFSTPENWSGGVVPVDGDDLVFDNDVFDFGDFDTPNIPNNDLGAVSFGSITAQGAGSSIIRLAGNEYTLSGGISASVSLNIASTVVLSADQGFAGGGIIIDSLDIDSYTLNVEEHLDASLSSLYVNTLSGMGIVNSSISTAVNDSIEGFTGSISVAAGGGLQLDESTILGSGHSVTIDEGARLTFCASDDYEYNGDITVGGSGDGGGFNNAINFYRSCGKGGGPGTVEPPVVNYTLSGQISLTADTEIKATQNQIITIENLETNGFSLSLSEDSSGQVIVGGETIVNEPKTTTIPAEDKNLDLSVQVLAQDTLVLNGSRDLVSVFGVLKGIGFANQIIVNGGAVLAPGLSPGCIGAGQLTLISGSSFEVEIAGTNACDDYDQVQVSGTVSLSDAILDVSFLNEFVPTVGDEFIIILKEGADPVVGTFDGLAEGAEAVVDGVTFTISYEGGDGNDVVLTVTDAPVVPDAPDTGFALVMANPIVTLLVSIASAATLFMIARRQFSNKH